MPKTVGEAKKRYFSFVLNNPTNPHLNLAQSLTVDTTVFHFYPIYISFACIYRYRLFQLTFFQLTW